MKFAEHLFTHLTSEWRSQYIQYDTMKVMLYKFVEEQPTTNPEEYFQEKDADFFSFCEEEVTKIDLFFQHLIADAEYRFSTLKKELTRAYNEVKSLKSTGSESISSAMKDATPSDFERGVKRRSVRITEDVPGKSSSMYFTRQKLESVHDTLQSHKKTLDSLKTAFQEFYLSLILVQNYQELNATGFRKILKKHDKLFGISTGLDWRAENVMNKEFVTNTRVTDLIQNVEQTYINGLEGGDRTKAMKRLRVPPLKEAESPWTTFRCGFGFGCFCVIAIVIAVSAYVKKLENDPPWIAVRLFRGFLIIFINIFLVGINHYGWQRNGVNNVLIFEIDPRNHLTYQHILELAASFLVLWGTCVLGYLFHDVIHIPKLLTPLLLMIIVVLWLVNPFRIWYWSTRKWFLQKCWLLLTPLCHPVAFADFWLADQLNSLVTFILDMEYFVCFYLAQVDWNGLVIKSRHLITESGGVSNITMSSDRWTVDLNTGADTCNSLVYGIRPLIAIIPASIRLFQCVRRFGDSRQRHPHLTNAGKYATTLFVILFGTLKSWYAQKNGTGANAAGNYYFLLWVVAYLASTSYTYIWDVWMDWGLGRCNTKKSRSEQNFLLREELVYQQKWYYYAAIVGDLFLRLAWTMNVSLNEFWFFRHGDILVCVTALLECFRRFMWNFFRLENEHLNNCGNFRAVRDISVKVIPREGKPVGEEGSALLKTKKRSSVSRMLNNIVVLP